MSLTRVVGENARAYGLDEIADPDSLADELRGIKDRLATVELAIKSRPEGLHNESQYADDKLFDDVIVGDTYKDKSLVMVMPSYKMIAPSVAFSWLRLVTPANHRVHRLSVQNCEVADAYNRAIELVLANPTLRDYRYVLTVEADNLAPPMGILQLMQDIEEAQVDVISGMYWGRSPGGAPMCFGKAGEVPRNFRPFVPPPNAVTRVNGCGMGFTLFKLDLFKRVSRPWFKTHQEYTNNVGMEGMLTQDLWWADKAAREVGAKFAVSTRVLVGHLDIATGVIF